MLTTSTHKVSGLIRAAINSDISHAMLCVARSSAMDSTSEGVQARNIQKIFYDDNSAIYILRLKDPLAPDKLNDVIKYARNSTGSSYSVKEAVATVAPNIVKCASTKQFCSRMVARAYKSVGISLVANPDFCTPEDLKNSNLLVKIEPAWVHVSDEEIQYVLAEGDATVKMREVTNNLLRKVRIIDQKIESVNDIDRLLIERPELDSQISDAFRSSGYLEHWKVEVNRFPWRYNSKLMLQFYHSLSNKEELIDYCRTTLQDHRNGTFDHWENHAKAYIVLNRDYPRDSFKLLIKLYLQLTSNRNQRIESAELILKIYGG